MTDPWRSTLDDALALIARVPGYAPVAEQLQRLRDRGAIRILPGLADRAHAGLLGSITLGPEPFQDGVLSLAETLVHEAFHLRQNPLEKTASFWLGVVTGAPVMRRYERPAYRAAADFLRAVAAHLPELADEAARERFAVEQVFRTEYGAELVPITAGD
jgi:hypothetical protein